MPALTTSLRKRAPSSRPAFATASGVPPARAIASVIRRSSVATAVSPVPGFARRIESTAPLRMTSPSASMPLMRVCAVNGTKVAPRLAMSRSRRPYFSLASTTIERPSGVSSASEASWAASARSRSSTPATGKKAAAWRLPSVIVPVLSSSSVSTSPAASTARPDIASTLKRTSRSMPAMPMAESSAPIVVGISVTKSATRTISGIVPPA